MSLQTKLHVNQPYDESLDVRDSESVNSTYTPSPRTNGGGGIAENSDNEIDAATGDRQMNKPGIRPSGLGVGNNANVVGSMGAHKSGSEDGETDEEDGSEDDSEAASPPGAYDPAEFEHLPVTPDIKELFQYITRFTPQTIDLEHKLKPFIPDYIPAVGDIDAFIKVPRPDRKPDMLGLTVLDEPCAIQSDPNVLDLMLRAQSKQSSDKAVTVHSVQDAIRDTKPIDKWIKNIAELHKLKPPPMVHYARPMPDIDSLMQEWPSQFEDLLRELSLPTADLECSLEEYVSLICAILDIPVHKSKVQSLHLLFSLYLEFKNSAHFRSLAANNQLDNNLKGE